MSSSVKKRKRTKKPSLKKNNEPSPVHLPLLESPIPSLPDDLLVSCFACISRLYYPTLSLVSKRFASLIASPQLYQTRSSLGKKETCLYVCLKSSYESNSRWFTLCRKPNISTKKKKKPSGYVLATVLKTPHSPLVYGSSYVSVGSNIYKIGGSSHTAPFSCVLILDCRSHTWRAAPSMRMARYLGAANVVDGKIYVAGNYDAHDWMEVFDPKTQSWEPVSCPFAENIYGNRIIKSAVFDEELYIFSSSEGVAYKPKEGKWKVTREMTRLYSELSSWESCCVIDNILYTCDKFYGIKWYDHSKGGVMIGLRGLIDLPNFAGSSRVKLADYGGKLVVLWDKYLASSGYENKMIWCAVIALERRTTHEMCGKVEWIDAVLTVPESYELVFALSVSI